MNNKLCYLSVALTACLLMTGCVTYPDYPDYGTTSTYLVEPPPPPPPTTTIVTPVSAPVVVQPQVVRETVVYGTYHTPADYGRAGARRGRPHNPRHEEYARRPPAPKQTVKKAPPKQTVKPAPPKKEVTSKPSAPKKEVKQPAPKKETKQPAPKKEAKQSTAAKPKQKWNAVKLRGVKKK